jgi:hypothetical protein
MRSWFIALAIVVTGCESAQEAVDKETPAAQQRFALYQTAVRAALAKPKFGDPVLPEKLVFSGGKGEVNAALILAAWIEMPVKHDEDGVLMEAANEFIDTRNLAFGSHPSSGGSPSHYREKFRVFDNLTYLIVVDGIVTGGSVSGSSYSGGGFGGNLYVVDVAKAASLGTLSVSSGMDDKVEVVTNAEGHSVDRQLQYNAKTHALKAIDAALAPYKAADSGPAAD